MILKIEGPIETFAKWKAMVHSNCREDQKIWNDISLCRN